MPIRFQGKSVRILSIAAVLLLSASGLLGLARLRADAGDGASAEYRTDRADHEHEADRVVLSFSTVGDSRQDPKTPDPTTLPLSGQDATWLQNTKAWSRIMRGVQEQGSDFLFFNGDMIMGYGNASFPSGAATVADVVGSDLVQFYRQYAFWRGMVAPLMEAGTYVVPVPGNHETQWKAGGKKALVVNENAWRANMGDLILDKARFEAVLGADPQHVDTANNGGLDGLVTDQHQLSYSFDFRGSHFAVVNTDATGADAHAPTNWLAADLAAARGRGIEHLFVFGHKPAFTYNFAKDPAKPLPASPSGLDNFPAARDEFWAVIEHFGATYFCGHEHIFDISQPTRASGGAAWQVLVGSGGSPFDALPTDVTLHPRTDRAYAWAHVTIHESGKVRLRAYGFSDQYGPTRLLRSVTLAH